MAETKNLYERLGSEAFELGIRKPSIPEYIRINLKHSLFDWQQKAIENLLTYEEIRNKKQLSNPTHLMFNMATGTGKTLLMAACIVYYYKQGYRHFIFFVNRNNIIDKTENNFINPNHNKYLFKEKIVIDTQTIDIKKVETFSDDPQGIEIKFTSIQKLYNDIHIEKENQTTLDDLHSKNIVMLADEAHHLNANTQSENNKLNLLNELTNKSSVAEVERKGWEHTVIELILNKNGQVQDNKNVLLEFTATVPANNKTKEKYQDKIIAQFILKEFLQAGYTKDINLLSSTLEKKERILQALIFQWYRHHIALKNNIANFKPVILFRSKTIEESKKDFEDFIDIVGNLKSEDFNFFKSMDLKITSNSVNEESGESRIKKIIKIIEDNNNDINYSSIVYWIQTNYQTKNLIITNSKSNKTQTEKTDEQIEKLLNSLEDQNNHIRAIFTVDRLTEGWDVLNLFDIVRLYQGQNAGGNTQKTPEATIKEKQLIGRGVRYFPFAYSDKPLNQRKFDNDLNNDLRVIEEFYYHTYDEESRYISHLKAELIKDGYFNSQKETIKTFDLKDSFKQTDFYKNIKVWGNKKKKNKNIEKNLDSIKKEWNFEYKVYGLEINEEQFQYSKDENKRLESIKKNARTNTIKFKDIERHIFLKAINMKAKEDGSLFRFDNFKNKFGIKSIEEIRNSNLLGGYSLAIISTDGLHYDEISEKEKLNISIKFLEKFSNLVEQKVSENIGTKEFFASNFEDLFGEPKTKIVEETNIDDSIANNNKWYVLDSFVGTSEEKDLVSFIKNEIANLSDKYDEIYLLRNEEIYKIYDFEKGRGFCPDFLLFLKTKNRNLYYQIFIEPKGDNLLDSDKWKETFLNQISKEYKLDIFVAENEKYKLIGMPFFNTAREQSTKEFAQNFEKNILNI